MSKDVYKRQINHLIDFRKQEGAALEKKFREKIENIARLLESVAPYEQERVGDVYKRQLLSGRGVHRIAILLQSLQTPCSSWKRSLL